MQYLFKGEEQPDLRIPRPILTTEDGAIIAGRPDAKALIGFQRGMKPGISRSFDEAVAKPAWIRGKFPVYVDIFDGTIFVVLEKIESVELIEKEHLGG